MKRFFVIVLALLATTATMNSYGKGGRSKKKTKVTTDTDSLAYAVGTSLATIAFELDPTLDLKVITNAFKDVSAQKGDMTNEESQAFIQEYMTVKMPLKNAIAGQEFIEDAIKDGADTLASGLAYKIEKQGSDRKVAIGDSVYVNYVMTLPNGKEIDKSPEGDVMRFLLQSGDLIRAWVEGVPLVGEGGKIILFVPSELAYGDRGTRGVGPNQAMKFEIEVVKVVTPPFDVD